MLSCHWWSLLTCAPPHHQTHHTHHTHLTGVCCPGRQVSGEKQFFAEMVVEAVSKLDPATLDLRMIGMKKVGA